MIYTKENVFKRFLNIIKKLFIKEKIKQIEAPKEEEKVIIKKTREELEEIYNKAKKGEYDLNILEIEDIKMLNKMIEAEIELKESKLDEIETDIKIKQRAISKKSTSD